MMIGAVVSLTLLGLFLGFALGFAARYLAVEENPLTAEVEALLPGTNCGQCGFPGCPAAADLLAKGEAPITLCPPGGKALAEALSEKLGVPLDLSDLEESEPMVAVIHEEECIGCNKCFRECPTDAVIGAAKQIHTIFMDACTGCAKCVDVCPTDCLVMEPVPQTLAGWRWPKPEPELLPKAA